MKIIIIQLQYKLAEFSQKVEQKDKKKRTKGEQKDASSETRHS